MREAVICEPVRTPIGRYGGMFKSLTAVDLGVTALKGLLERTGLAPDAVQDVILGHCYPNSEAPAIGRVVALDSGLPVTVPGMQVDRRCGSGLQAVIQACLQVGAGDNDLVVAGGCESMSNVAFYSTDMRWGGARNGVRVHDGLARGRTTAGGRHYPVPGGMLETAENLRRQYGISRQEQDELAARSHQRAVAAQKDGVLAEEIVPVAVRTRSGEELIGTDEHPRADTSVESLGHPIAAVTNGLGSQASGGGSGAGLGQREGGDDVARRHWLEPALLLLIGAEADENLSGDAVVRAEHRPQRQRGVAQFHCQLDVLDKVEAKAAPLLRNGVAEQAHRLGLLAQITGYPIVGQDLLLARDHRGADKLTGRLEDRLEVLVRDFGLFVYSRDGHAQTLLFLELGTPAPGRILYEI